MSLSKSTSRSTAASSGTPSSSSSSSRSAACCLVRGNPSSMKPSAASGRASRSLRMPSMMSSETSCPAAMVSFALAPKRVPATTASRNISPVDICGMPFSASSLLACVPFPDPGAPSKTIRICISRYDSKSVIGQMPGSVKDATGKDRERQFDYRRTRDPGPGFRYADAPSDHKPEVSEECPEETRFTPSPAASPP